MDDRVIERKRFHLVISVKEEQFEGCFDYYQKMFSDTPFVCDITSEPSLVLGTGKAVRGAYWQNDYINFYLIIEDGVHGKGFVGIDHMGIEFPTEAEAQEKCHEMGDRIRFEKDPTGIILWEIWSNEKA